MKNRESRTPVLNGVTALGPINKTGFAAVTSLGGCIRECACARTCCCLPVQIFILQGRFIGWLSINGFISRRNGWPWFRTPGGKMVELAIVPQAPLRGVWIFMNFPMGHIGNLKIIRGRVSRNTIGSDKSWIISRGKNS